MNHESKIVRSITGVTCVMLVAKVLAMLRNILQARVYGADAEIDAFTQAGNYSVALFTTVAYALCVAAIPIFSHKLLEGREACHKAADRLISNTLLLALGLTAVLFALGASGVLEQWVGITQHPELFRFCFLALVMALPIITLTYLLLALFQSMGHFTLQGSLSLLYSVALCGALVVFGKRMELKTFVVLTSACWLLQLAMTFPLFKKEHYRFHFSLDLRQKEYWMFLRTGAATVFNSALFLLCYLINTRFAAGAAEGTISSFFYANKLYEPLTTTLIYSVSIVLFPHFSQQYEKMTHGAYREYVVGILKHTLVLVLPVSALFAAFGTPVIQVLFQGGSFTMEDSLRCGGIFSLYCLGMAGFFLLDLLNKAYYAMGKTLVPMCVTAGILVLCGSLNALAVHFAPASPQLLAGGTSLGFLLGGLVLYGIFAHQGEGEKTALPWKEILWSGALSLLLGLGAHEIYLHWIAGDGKLLLVVKCAVVGVIGMALYLLAMGPVGPTRELLRKLRGRNEA